MNEKVEIGKVCYKGPHTYFEGETDYGVCGSHEYATIYVHLEDDYPNPRGGTYTVAEVKARIRRAFEALDREEEEND